MGCKGLICVAVLTVLGWGWEGWAQARHGAWSGNHGAANSSRGAPATGHAQASPRFGVKTPSSTHPPVGSQSFASNLGRTVGLRALPPVSLPPGVGNINQPGIQPLPTGALPAIPNINFPGGVPTVQYPTGPFSPLGPPQLPGQGLRGMYVGRGGFGPAIVFYGVPFYVRVPTYGYIIYSPSVATSPPTETPAGPYSYREPAEEPPATPATETPAARPVTLLAFKDHTIVVVTDYWLEGEMLFYETSPGVRTAVPLDRVDLILTQQLNRERNVRFVLEARP